MGVDLYTVKKNGVMVSIGNNKRETVHFLQLTVEHALSQDSQGMVDLAITHACMDWAGRRDLPRLVVQVGNDGVPRPGAPIYRWQFHKRAFCFDHELSRPLGYLGDRELWGYLFRSEKEQVRLRDLETARGIDEGTAKVYKDFWKGMVFESGEEFLKYRNRFLWSQRRGRGLEGGNQPTSRPRLSKILTLIRLIERKGNSASPADLHFLGCLKDKASQLADLS